MSTLPVSVTGSVVPTWLETERRPPCKRNDAGANPVVGPGLENDCPDGVAERTSEFDSSG
jgi:hypothetical protein